MINNSSDLVFNDMGVCTIEFINFITNIMELNNIKILEKNYDNQYIIVSFNESKYICFIVYSNTPQHIKVILDQSLSSLLPGKVVLFSFLTKSDISGYFNENINAFYGKEELKKLKEKYIDEWINFLFFTDSIYFNSILEDNNYILIGKSLPYGIEKFKLNDDLLNKIFILNIKEFKKRMLFHNPAIFIGNGVSIPFGADSWNNLTVNLLDYLTPFYIDNLDKIKNILGNSLYAITELPQELMIKKDYDKALSHCIYRKYTSLMHNDGTILRKIVEIKTKNKDIPIITYNYDDFFEKDYKIYNKKDIMSISNVNDDKKTNEPKIIHIHGTISSSDPIESKNIILTEKDYNRVYNNIGYNWVTNKQIDTLVNNVCLYVGSSMTDLFQNRIIEYARKKWSESNYALDYGPWRCFAIVCYKDISLKDKIVLMTHYSKRKICLIIVDNFSEIPTVLEELFN